LQQKYCNAQLNSQPRVRQPDSPCGPLLSI
jgi:hypothetical protein